MEHLLDATAQGSQRLLTGQRLAERASQRRALAGKEGGGVLHTEKQA